MRGQSQVHGVLLMVAVTVIAGVALNGVVQVSLPDESGDDRSPLDRTHVVDGLDLRGSSYTGLYDSRADEWVAGDLRGVDGEKPDDLGDAIEEMLDRLSGAPTLPDDSHVESGSYLVRDGSESVITRWDHEHLTFDTTSGAIVIGVEGSDDGRILLEGTHVHVEGDHHVAFFVATDDWHPEVYLDDVEVSESTTPDQLRIYAQEQDATWGDDNVEIEASRFRGIVYAPGNPFVTVRDSEFYGAAVAEEVRFEGSGYFHDVALEQPGHVVLPRPSDE